MLINKFRLRVFLIIVLILSVILSIRIIYLSSLNSNEYKILESKKFVVRRGDIFDAHDRLLATSDELDSVYANPGDVEFKKEAAITLGKILKIPASKIYSDLTKDKSFVWIKRQITPAQANRVKKANIDGIDLIKEYKRFYPNKSLAAQILGFCDVDNKGQEGLEKSMNSYLIPSNRKELKNENNENRGGDVYLTIDSNIQAIGEQVIRESVLTENADSGSLILLDGKTGEIMCMANYPSYDPNFYNRYSQKYFRNFSIFNQYEPGSVLKIFSIASLLDLTLIDESDFYFCDGVYEENNVTVKCTGNHASINYLGVIKYSCNDAMLQASHRIEVKNIYTYLKSFGFGMRTSIMLPGEQAGILRDIDAWSFRSGLSVPLGQEISVNALQIVRAATFLVNDGVIIAPYIVKKVLNKDRKEVFRNERQEVRRVVRPGIAEKILDAMKTAAMSGGTAEDLNNNSMVFSAKSGTGQIYDNTEKKYLDDQFTSSLLVVFPYENPRYIGYVVFHRPKGEVKWGGVIGAKTINRLINDLSGYYIFNEDNSYYINESEL